MNIEKIIISFLLFLQCKSLDKILINNRLRTILNLIFVNTVIVLLSVLIVLLFFRIIEITTGLDLVESTKGNVLNNYSKLEFFSIGVLLAPILEELCFRYPLKPSKISISVSLGLLIGTFLSKWVFIDWSIYTRLLISLAIFILSYFAFTVNTFEFNFSKKITNFLYYFSSLLFGLIHLRNQISIEWYEIILSPIITMPQLFMGLFLGYIRINFGLRYSIIIHCVNNLIPFLLKY